MVTLLFFIFYFLGDFLTGHVFQDLLDASPSNSLNECQVIPLDEMPFELQYSWIEEFTSKTSDLDTTSTAEPRELSSVLGTSPNVATSPQVSSQLAGATADRSPN